MVDPKSISKNVQNYQLSNYYCKKIIGGNRIQDLAIEASKNICKKTNSKSRVLDFEESQVQIDRYL